MAGRDDVAVFAISYDPVDTLASFASEQNVTYPLLADLGSVEIKRLGMLNDTIVEERLAWGQEMDDQHRDLPYPGTFLLDEDGVVIEKKFERSHRLRASGTALIQDLLGEGTEPAVSGSDTAPGVQGAAWLDQAEYFPGQRLYANLRLQVDAGLHLYVPPLGKGYIPLTVAIDDAPELIVEDAEIPSGAPFTVEGLSEKFFVVEETVDVRVPFYFSDEAAADATLALRVGYQACNDLACFAPEELRIELPITYLPIPRP